MCTGFRYLLKTLLERGWHEHFLSVLASKSPLGLVKGVFYQFFLRTSRMGKVNAEYDLIPSSRALGAGILFVSNERTTGFCRMFNFSVVMAVMDVLYQEC